MNESHKRWCLNAAGALLVAAAVTFWVDLADSGRSGFGQLIGTAPSGGARDHLYGDKAAGARMLYEGLSYVALLLQLIGAVLVALGLARRLVLVAATVGALASLHRCVLVVLDQRHSWMLDLALSVVALAGCALAAAVSIRAKAATVDN